MKTAAEYLDAIRQRHNLPSDYSVRTLLGVTKQSISRYRTGHDHFSPETCEKVADLLGIDLEIVLLDAQESRARTDAERAAWHRLAQRLATAACAAGIFVVSAGMHEAKASYDGPFMRRSSDQSLLCKVRRSAKKAVRSLLNAIFPQGFLAI